MLELSGLGKLILTETTTKKETTQVSNDVMSYFRCCIRKSARRSSLFSDETSQLEIHLEVDWSYAKHH